MASSDKQKTKRLVISRAEFETKYGPTTTQRIRKFTTILMRLYWPCKDICELAWKDQLTWKNADRMLTRINYVRSDEGNTLNTIRERVDRG